MYIGLPKSNYKDTTFFANMQILKAKNVGFFCFLSKTAQNKLFYHFLPHVLTNYIVNLAIATDEELPVADIFAAVHS